MNNYTAYTVRERHYSGIKAIVSLVTFLRGKWQYLRSDMDGDASKTAHVRTLTPLAITIHNAGF